MRVWNNAMGGAASNDVGEGDTAAAIIWPSGAIKNNSLPSRRQRAAIPPFVEICHLPPRGRNGLQIQNEPDGVFDLGHSCCGHFGCGSPCRRKPGRVQRTDLKAEEYGVVGKPGLRGGHTDVDGIVSRNVSAIGSNHDRNNQRLPIDGISRDDHDRAASGLLVAFHRTEINEIDVASMDHTIPSPSVF